MLGGLGGASARLSAGNFRRAPYKPANSLGPQSYTGIGLPSPSLQGSLTNLAKVAPAAGISWLVFEQAKLLMSVDPRR